MLPVSDSWHDYLWAYYKAMIETIIEQVCSTLVFIVFSEFCKLFLKTTKLNASELVFIFNLIYTKISTH